MRIAIASDHGGFKLKEAVVKHLIKEHEVFDKGTYSNDSCHYPTYALEAALSVQRGETEKGIVICTSGEGVAIMANKVKGIRCGLAYNEEVASLIVEHNNCNMVSIGANFFSEEEAIKMIDIFLKAQFLKDRHAIRVGLISEYEDKVYR